MCTVVYLAGGQGTVYTLWAGLLGLSRHDEGPGRSRPVDDLQFGRESGTLPVRYVPRFARIDSMSNHAACVCFLGQGPPGSHVRSVPWASPRPSWRQRGWNRGIRHGRRRNARAND